MVHAFARISLLMSTKLPRLDVDVSMSRNNLFRAWTDAIGNESAVPFSLSTAFIGYWIGVPW